MSPPLYNELGKSAKDLFNKGYNFDTIKLDVKTKTPAGVEFTSGGVSQIDSGKIVGTLETKYRLKEYGIIFTEKWNTNNILTTEAAIQDFVKGAKFAAECSFAPQTGDKTLKLKSEFKHDYVSLNGDADFKSVTPLINLAGVLGYRNWLSGYQLQFDCKNSKLKNNNLALGYAAPDFVIHTNVKDGEEFNGYIYQKLNPFLETGVELAWSSKNNDTKFGLGCKYILDRDTSFKAKVNNANQVSLGFSQRINSGVIFNVSTLIDGKNFNQGGHKIGFGIDVEP